MRWLAVLAIAACGGDHSQAKPIVPQDAPAPHIPPVTEPAPVRIDPDTHRQPPGNRASKPIDVILRSTPQGASAAVDGVPLGTTPAYWNGTADGREHEFTFVLPKHAVARYRFVPITSGVIHARLEPISEDQPDAGVQSPLAPGPAPSTVDPSPPGIPTFTPDAAIMPPPTVITPDAGDAQSHGLDVPF
ncbi:MAG TPA: hypothetical protein VGC41_17465 [Kofleriaceae bacterium]